MNKFSRSLLAVATSSVLLATAACGSSEQGSSGGSDDGKLKVVTAFYPLEYLAQQVGGDKVEITNLTASGADAHGVELTPRQVASLSDADMVLYIKGFSHNIDKAVEESKPKHTLDAASLVTPLANAEHEHEAEEGHEGETEEEHAEHAEEGHAEHAEEGHDEHDHGPNDPHIWLDPKNMLTIADGLQKELAGIDSANAEVYETNAKAVDGQLTELDESFKTGLKTCDRKEFITSHEAFGYLAHAYGLEQIGIAGLSTEDEPSPARIAEVQKLAKQHGVTTIFYETQISPAHSEAIAGDLGLKTDVLDPVATLSDKSRGKNYVEVMQANLAALRTANGCK